MLRATGVLSLLLSAATVAAVESSSNPVPPAGPATLQRGKKSAGKKKAPPPPLRSFAGSLPEARAHAKDRNVPLVLVAIVEGEGYDPSEHDDIEGFREELMGDKDVAAAVERAVVLVTCNAPHELIEVTEVVDGQEVRKKRCPRYPVESCTLHQKPFDQIYRAYQDAEGELHSPTVVIERPDREVEEQWSTGASPDVGGILAALERAKETTGEGLSEAEWVTVRGLAREAEEHLEKKRWPSAWRATASTLEITTATHWADEARARQVRAGSGIEAQRDGAIETMEKGAVVEGYKVLLSLSADVTGTPFEKSLPRLVKKFEKDKAYREAIDGYKREVTAQELFLEAQKLYRAGEPKKGIKKLRVIARKYADTPAGAKARKAWPEDWAEVSGG